MMRMRLRHVPAAFPGPRMSCTNTKALLDHATFPEWAAELTREADQLAAAGFVVLLPAQLLDSAAHAFDATGIGWGAQNVWPDPYPPTGEISAEALAHAGCRYVMAGHPERRTRLGEDDAAVAASAATAAEHGMIPVVCVGESGRSPAEEAVAVVTGQARPVLDAVPGRAPLAWLYEPPWASAEHEPAPPAQVAAVAAALRHLSSGRTAEVRVLYGGAVVPGVWRVLQKGGCRLDGLGVGKAAYDAPTRQAVTAELVGTAVRAQARS
jgi:triosephosphate isomerase